MEMQRKLSAIAEIPKILSSTLATVSQSFGSLSSEAAYMQRKFSYDEDALDYDLMEQTEDESDSEGETVEHRLQRHVHEEEDEEDDDLVQVHDDNVIELAMKQLKSKDLTPESDYASEANYATNELSDEPENDNDVVVTTAAAVDDDADDDKLSENMVYYIKLPAVPAVKDNMQEATTADAEYVSSDCASSVADENEDANEDDSDFLSTTYTWNLRNVPKLSINDADGVCDLTLSPQLEQQSAATEATKTRAATPTPPTTAGIQSAIDLPASAATSAICTSISATTETAPTQKMLFKLDNHERSWPWADREKIIYKQSTCHLVTRKPLGIVGKRIQTLAQKELLRKD